MLWNLPPQTSSGAGGHGDLAHAMRRRTPKRTTRSAEEAEECAERERGAGEGTPAARVEDEEAKEEHLFQPPSAEAPEPPPAETPEPPVDAFVDNKHEAEFMDDQCWAARELPQLNEESDAEYDEDPAGSFKPLHARKVGETKVKMRVEGPVRQPEVGLPDGGLEPAEVFQIFFGPALQTLVVAQTNLYASQQKAKVAAGLASARSAAAAANAACPASPVNPREWKPINRISLMKYIAIIIFKGVMGLGSIPEYWGDRTMAHAKGMAYTGMPEIAESGIRRMEFQQFLRYVHCADNSQAPMKEDPAYDKA